jgi:amino acid adenylation domain-containing protein
MLSRGRASDLAPQRDYWNRKLAALPGSISLPGDAGWARERTGALGTIERIIDGRTTHAVRALAGAHDVSASVCLLAASSVVLHRYSQRDEICVASGVPRPLDPGPEGVLILSFDVGDDPSFRKLLLRIHGEMLEALENRHVTLSEIIESVSREREIGPGEFLRIQFQMGEHSLDRGDLALDIRERSDGLVCRYRFSCDVYSETWIERFHERLIMVLEQATDRVDRPISDVSLLSDAERRLVTQTFNQTDEELPETLMPVALATRAEDRPDAVAIEQGERTLTYAELEQSVVAVASRLREDGCGRGSIVAVVLERSPEFVTSICGVMRAGAAYLPIDPQHPAERIESILSDAGPAAVITSAALSRALSIEVPVLTPDDFVEEPALEAPSDFPVLGSGDLAYVIYTSGTTGRPKGVMIDHGSLANFIWTAVDSFGVTPEDRVLQFMALDFDGSLEEIFESLAVGATLVLRTDEMLSSIEHFLDECERLSITSLVLPTSFWKELASAMSLNGLRLPSRVRSLVGGGGDLSVERLRQWLGVVGPGFKTINGYGPTETTLLATWADLSEDPPPQGLLGRPMSNKRVYLLDASGDPVPVGVPGEVYIGGKGVGIGYLNQPALTEERFTPDPFDARPGARLYRTGDMALWHEDGTLAFLGRCDRQVKVGGFRLEPDEVETVLKSHHLVKDAAIVTTEAGGSVRLIAYFVPDGHLEATEVRTYLSSRLPYFMVPAQITPVESLTRTMRGKNLAVDFLPAPQASNGDHVAPYLDLEKALAAIWADVLQVPRVGMTDDFFDLGGHSLLAMRVVSKVRHQLHIDVSLASIFEHPRFADFTDIVSGSAGTQDPGFEELLAEVENMSDEDAARAAALIQDDP